MNIILGFGLAVFFLWAFIFGIKCFNEIEEYRYMVFDETKLLFFISIFLLALWLFLKYLF